MMLMFMILMTMLIMNPGVRDTLGGMADPILSPWLPEESYFIVTVLILGSISMTVNTVLRNFFMDPMAQAHIGHRQGEVRKAMNDARISRDPILQEKATLLQQQMMPEQLSVQMGAMKPMMFTMVFIIAIFAWLTTSVENFRVDYVSLPWTPEWNLLNDSFLFFPAWICAYICMSAPLGRIVDRHIKLFRYKSNPLVAEGKKIKEPLLHLIAPAPVKSGHKGKNNRRQNQSKSKAKSASKERTKFNNKPKQNKDSAGCPDCGSEDFKKDGPNTKICSVCLTEWV